MELAAFMEGVDRQVHPFNVATDLMVAALHHLLKYGEEGLDQAGNDFSLICQRVWRDRVELMEKIVPFGTTIH